MSRLVFARVQFHFFPLSFLPYIGYVTIAMVRTLSLVPHLRGVSGQNLMGNCLLQNDFPQLKYALLGGLGLLALVQRE